MLTHSNLCVPTDIPTQVHSSQIDTQHTHIHVQLWVCMHMCLRIQIHVHTSVCPSLLHTHTHTHTWRCVYKHLYVHAHTTHTHIYAQLWECMHMCKGLYAPPSYTHTHTWECVYKHMYMHTSTRIHKCVHSHTDSAPTHPSPPFATHATPPPSPAAFSPALLAGTAEAVKRPVVRRPFQWAVQLGVQAHALITDGTNRHFVQNTLCKAVLI